MSDDSTDPRIPVVPSSIDETRVQPAVTVPPTSDELDAMPGAVHEEERVRQLPDGSFIHEYERTEQPLIDEPRRWQPWVIGGIVVLALAALGLWYFTRTERATVAAVVGQPLAAARTQLEQDGFKLQVTRRSSAKKPGIVLAELPVAGTRADKGSVVALTVAASPATVTVPNAVGLSQTDARDRLVAAGFTVTSASVGSDQPSGNVTAQAPAAGDKAARGSSIRINVSKGSATASVPSEVGQPSAAAQQDLAANGFKPTVVQVASSEPAGTVVSQDPSGGQARKGATVQLSVSSGPDTTTATTTETVTVPTTSTDATTGTTTP